MQIIGHELNELRFLVDRNIMKEFSRWRASQRILIKRYACSRPFEFSFIDVRPILVDVIAIQKIYEIRNEQ